MSGELRRKLTKKEKKQLVHDIMNLLEPSISGLWMSRTECPYCEKRLTVEAKSDKLLVHKGHCPFPSD